VKKRIVLN